MIFQLPVYWSKSYEVALFPPALSTERAQKQLMFISSEHIQCQIYLLNMSVYWKKLGFLDEIADSRAGAYREPVKS